jgi:hypothetical protein
MTIKPRTLERLTDEDSNRQPVAGRMNSRAFDTGSLFQGWGPKL